jgi:hypothetical protein
MDYTPQTKLEELLIKWQYKPWDWTELSRNNSLTLIEEELITKTWHPERFSH